MASIERRSKTLLQLQVKLYLRVIISIVIMALLIAFVSFFEIPNPNMILITGLVICSALFGFGGGGVAALIMFYYTLYFFSTNHSFVEYSGQNLQKVMVSFVGIIVDMFLVCTLKQTEVRAFKELTRWRPS